MRQKAKPTNAQQMVLDLFQEIPAVAKIAEAQTEQKQIEQTSDRAPIPLDEQLSIANSGDEKSRQSLAGDSFLAPEAAEILAKDKIWEVRCALGLNDAISTEIVDTLAGDSHPHVATMAAIHPKLSEEGMWDIAHNAHATAQKFLMANPVVNPDVRDFLKQSTNPYVAEMAQDYVPEQAAEDERDIADDFVDDEAKVEETLNRYRDAFGDADDFVDEEEISTGARIK